MTNEERRADDLPEVRIRVDGAPTGKGRPRFVRSTGHAHTPARTKTAEARIANAWTNSGAVRLPDGPVSCEVEAVIARPGSHWKVNGTLTAAGTRSVWPTKKPDLDNIIKLVGDALNGLAYRDDADIVHVRAVRRWCNPGERDHTLIVLRSVGLINGDGLTYFTKPVDREPHPLDDGDIPW